MNGMPLSLKKPLEEIESGRRVRGEVVFGLTDPQRSDRDRYEQYLLDERAQLSERITEIDADLAKIKKLR